MSLRASTLAVLLVFVCVQSALGLLLHVQSSALHVQQQRSASAFTTLQALSRLSRTAEPRFQAFARELLTDTDLTEVRAAPWEDDIEAIERVIAQQEALGVAPVEVDAARRTLGQLKITFLYLEDEITAMMRFFEVEQLDAAQIEVRALVAEVTQERVTGILETLVAHQASLVDETLQQAESLTVVQQRTTLLGLASGTLIMLCTSAALLVWVLRSVHTLNARTESISSGDLTIRTTVTGPEELEALGRAFDAMQEQLVRGRQQLAEEVARRWAAQDAAMAANRAKSSFLANMSHELRTPLTAILGYAELLAEDVHGQSATDVDRILVAGKHLLTLVSDILDLAKIEAGHLGTHIEPVDVAALCEELVSSLMPALTRNHNEVELHLSSTVGTFHTDASKLRQCLTNLLGNAGKFTEHGSITLSAICSGDVLSFTVRDTGVGIEAEQLPFVFDEFHQVDGSSTRTVEGSGLGLAITKHLVELLGGDVRVRSEVGKGSTFIVRLPDLADRVSHSSTTPGEDSVRGSKELRG
ncbi:MAG: HAMP domain-containing protein [Myxococcales bacterium]|nr:HAMP domain-containing protein [Myxococcales bacterium]